MIDLAARCQVESMFIIVPTSINQTFNPAYHFAENTESFFTDVIGMTPSSFCVKFANWAVGQNGEYDMQFE